MEYKGKQARSGACALAKVHRLSFSDPEARRPPREAGKRKAPKEPAGPDVDMAAPPNVSLRASATTRSWSAPAIFWYVRAIIPRVWGPTSYALVTPGEAAVPRGVAMFARRFLSPDRNSRRFPGTADTISEPLMGTEVQVGEVNQRG
ncbi:hypothetical protein MLAC_13850 [Mycobacterium lacus]|uniref:Uncharacterized protein n=1 Tax=Mycobacterium lacus TaxID=169765 RepID=A0A7I7NK81_9MYCO|nr:hypothetical protein MLAC_13850 [Mycobacterium lacus]